MKQYLDIVKKVLTEGQWKSPTRKNPITGKWEPVDGGVKTMACANVLFSHNMKDGFPLLTTKKVAWKSVKVELEGFIKGITSKSWYQDRGCKIWNEWANPTQVSKTLDSINFEEYNTPQIKKTIQLEEDDLGPIYGFQWRRFNQCYDDDDDGWAAEKSAQVAKDADQLHNIVNTLKTNPMDRRMVCSAWNPLQMSRMALPPCHWGWNVTVIGDELNLFWVQRSCDLMLGVPFNIASYGLLLELLAKVGGFRAGNLSGMLVDCHIYENQIDGAWEQVSREPKELPALAIRINDLPFDIFQWTHNDAAVVDYNPHPPIQFGDVIV